MEVTDLDHPDVSVEDPHWIGDRSRTVSAADIRRISTEVEPVLSGFIDNKWHRLTAQVPLELN